MKKLLLILLVSSISSIYAMDEYDQLRDAIGEGDKSAIRRLISRVKLTTFLDEQRELTPLTLALENPDPQVAQCVAEEVSTLLAGYKETRKGKERKRQAEACLYYPFQRATRDRMERLMSLKIPDYLKKRGCLIAFDRACKPEYPRPYMVKLLVTSYPEYIELPCKGASFERLIVSSTTNREEEIVETVLRHPKTAGCLKQMIDSNDMVYPKQRQKYVELLERAQRSDVNVPAQAIQPESTEE